MDEQMIHSIIDDIANAVKTIISEHLHPECNELVDALDLSAKRWEAAGIETTEAFRELEKDVREYLEQNNGGISDEPEPDEFDVGDEIYCLKGGAAVKDRIKDVMVLTESGRWLRVDDIFHSMDGLVEHLKKDVRG